MSVAVREPYSGPHFDDPAYTPDGRLRTPTLDTVGLVDPANLVSIGQIARRVGRSPAMVYHWRHDHHGLYPGFPKPIAQDGQWLVFHWPDVAAWIERRFGCLDRPVCTEDLDEV